jgi:TRAP-type C4-dicarboxylate transport system substrate-binding protein
MQRWCFFLFLNGLYLFRFYYHLQRIFFSNAYFNYARQVENAVGVLGLPSWTEPNRDFLESNPSM